MNLKEYLEKMGHSRPLFLYFRLINTVDSKQINVRYKTLLMTEFKPWTSGIISNRSTNWATTTAFFKWFKLTIFLFVASFESNYLFLSCFNQKRISTKFEFFDFQFENWNVTGDQISTHQMCTVRPDLAKFATLAKCPIFEGLFTIWKDFGPSLANFVLHWANFQRCKRPNVEK